MIDLARWQQLQAVFHSIVDTPEPERAARLAAACGEDRELLEMAAQLLEEDGRPGPLLDGGVAQAAEHVLGDVADPGQFGPYKVVEKIGEGGMGVVYLAERPELGQRVAIKVLGDAWVSPARRERFAAEQRVLARLHHPAIATLFDAATLPDGTPYFVMEYVRGLHLTTYCTTHDSSLAERLRLFRQCCEAVQHAHQQLIIHRDLKPSNIMVTEAGAVKLLDFGIAKQLESVLAPMDQTIAFRPLTPQYAAPEQVSGGQVGVFTDVYSLGVILYELLAGRVPQEVAELPRHDRTPGLPKPPQPPSAAAIGTGRAAAASRSEWADLDVMCASAMHPDRLRRYKSVDALLDDLDRFAKGLPLAARADSVRYRTSKFVRRHAAAVAISGTALLLVIGLVAFYTVRLTTARNAAVAEAARRERVQAFMLHLFDAGEKDAAPAADLRVVALVDRGLKEAHALESDPRVQAELYLTLGLVYQQLGNFPQADSLLRRALDRRRAIAPAGSTDVPESLVALGLLREHQGQLDEAERLIQEGFDIARRDLPRTDPTVARATLALGKIYDDKDQRDRAIPLLEEAVRMYTVPGPPTADLAGSLTTLANSHYNAGHLDLSEQLNRRVLEIDRELHGDAHPSVADDLLNLGTIQYDRGNYAESERDRREALELLRKWYGEEHPETASAMTLVAQTLGLENKLDEAETLLNRALAIQLHAYGPVHPRVGLVLNDLGILQSRKDHDDQAAESFTRALEVFRKVYPEGHSRVAVAQGNLATVYLNKHDAVRAEKEFRDVLRQMAALYPDDHFNIAITRIKLGRALVQQQRYRDAEPYLTAGYNSLSRQTSAGVSWLQAARQDLAVVFDALGQPARAATFRADYAANAHDQHPRS